jgi:predicted NBD/HSP70 family sugar kinase
MDNFICIDIGGTTFSFIIFINKNIYFRSELYNIKNFSDYKSFIIFLTNSIKREINENKISQISVACPGPLNSKTGQILNTPNLTFLQNVNLKNEIRKYINCKNIIIENDANVFTLGCLYDIKNNKNYNISDKDVLLGITLGTGIGFGIIINNRLFRGSYGMAGEYELSPLLNELTWSDLIGYKFFINKTKKIFNRILSPKELFYLAEKNNLDALSIWREYGKSIGLCLSHIIGILNPNHITIGGGISRANKYFHKEIINSIKKYCIIYNSDNLKFHYDTDNLNIYYGGLRLNHNNI